MINEKNGLKYISFNNFDNTNLVRHCYSTRTGGVSDGYLSSLNLGFNRGDTYENVMENYNRICSAISVDINKTVFSHQVHKTGLRVVGENDWGKGVFTNSDIREVDGLLTNKRGTVLVTFYADCTPLFFLDPIKKAIATSHAGWRGTVQNIGGKTVEKMREVFGSNPCDIMAGIGPSISQKNFEVGVEVYEEFRKKLPFSEEFIIRSKEKENKFHIDLWGINKTCLENAGIPKENIEVSGYCTMGDSDLFYSHRRDGDKRGSHAAFLSLI